MAFWERFFAWTVVVVPKRGLTNDTVGKDGDERRNCRVAGTGLQSDEVEKRVAGHGAAGWSRFFII